MSHVELAVPEPETRRILAPGGSLRVGLYPGSPTSLMGDPARGNARGVGHDLGHELARKLGVPFEPVVFGKNAQVLEAAGAGRVDLVFTNATAARAAYLDFTPTVLEIEQGYLVGPGCAIASASEVDRAGVRIAVVEGSTSQAVLSTELKQVTIVPVSTLEAAREALRAAKADAVASNKSILAGMRDGLPGASILAGAWGIERFALGIPKGRERALPWLSRFAEASRSLPAVRDFAAS